MDMETSYAGSLKGQFLIAMPSLMDPNFRQTVVCISEHTSEGAVGLIINRIHERLRAKAIFDELGMTCEERLGQAPIHIGGPVHMSEVFLLHGPPFDGESSLEINPVLAMSTTREVLQRIAWGKGPESFLIVLGCAGWAPGQLEQELQQNAWLTTEAVSEVIFQVPVEKRWEAALRHMGIEPAMLIASSGRA
jgi:putative transcriptional regulator